ncbi:hypothetical protein A8U91_03113 [Halomonas elongata]|uniref:Uncharacterized protein n=1 Tax=Halomonas elongata TaxID=2746 RepID=A0A1B8NVN4_HALEL|nr:hypothetical protein A8U91_03113 [Halomonas elongata]
MTLEGKQLIGAQAVSAEGAVIQAVNPATNERLDPGYPPVARPKSSGPANWPGRPLMPIARPASKPARPSSKPLPMRSRPSVSR